MIEEIIEFKRKLEELKNTTSEAIDKATICKVLVMLNIAEMVIRSNTKVEDKEKHYFEGQAFIGRYFGDLGLDWIAEDYLKISLVIKEKYF
jgi:uncharacterized protein involved in tellurium resistance